VEIMALSFRENKNINGINVKINDKAHIITLFSGVHVTQSLVLCVCFVDRCLSFVLFPLAIVLFVLLR
jgi:hypothetical protein